LKLDTRARESVDMLYTLCRLCLSHTILIRYSSPGSRLMVYGIISYYNRLFTLLKTLVAGYPRIHPITEGVEPLKFEHVSMPSNSSNTAPILRCSEPLPTSTWPATSDGGQGAQVSTINDSQDPTSPRRLGIMRQREQQRCPQRTSNPRAWCVPFAPKPR
jgi:hypothetical protein